MDPQPITEAVRTTVGKRIRATRELKKLSQTHVAFLCELHPSHLSKIERGEVNATLQTIVQIAIALEISLSDLFHNISLTAPYG